MSGNALDHLHYKLQDAKETIAEYLDRKEDLSEDTRQEIKRGMEYLRLASIYSYAIELLMDEDYDEEDFLCSTKERLRNED